jgi:ParB family chromosome partitioning protein
LSSTETSGHPTAEVPVASIRPNPHQPRRTFEPTALQELADSIQTHGLLQPLLVTPAADGFVLIAGERRWRASQLAGLTAVPVVVREVAPQDMLALAVIENVQRADLNAVEAGEAYQHLIDDFGLTQAEVAAIVGKSRVSVANTVRLLGLADDVLSLVSAGQLSEGHGRALLPLADPAEQLAMARRVLGGEWTVRRTEDEVRAAAGRTLAGERTPRRKKGAGGEGPDADTADAVRQLEAVLGTRVEIRRRGEAGTVVIHFYSEEELSALYDRFVP